MKDESQQQVPPNIVAFKNESGIWPIPQRPPYADWVKHHLNQEIPSTIHTISVDGKEYSVEDETNKGSIAEFFFTTEWWCAIYGYDKNCKVSWLIKPPPSSPDRSGSQPGKEEAQEFEKYAGLNEVITTMAVNGFRSVSWTKLLQEINFALAAALKSKPTDGWSDTDMKEAFEHGCNYMESSGFAPSFNKWLTEYKKTQTK